MALTPAFNPKAYKARLLNPYVLELYYETQDTRHFMQFDFFTQLMTMGDGDGAKAVKTFQELNGEVIRDMRLGMEKLGGMANVGFNDRERLFSQAAKDASSPDTKTPTLLSAPKPLRKPKGSAFGRHMDGLMEGPIKTFHDF